MSNELTKQPANILNAMTDFVSKTGLDNVKTNFNSKTGIVSITGAKNGIQYTTTLRKQLTGIMQTTSQFPNNLSKDILVSQIKQLISQGYKQTEIATMLGISQSLVSKYSRLK